MTKQSQRSGNNSTNFQAARDINISLNIDSFKLEDNKIIVDLNNIQTNQIDINKSIFEKLSSDFNKSFVGMRLEAKEAYEKVYDIVDCASLLEKPINDHRLKSRFDWQVLPERYNEYHYQEDLKRIHEFCDGRLVMSAPSVSAAACSCFSDIAYDLKSTFGTECIVDIYGRAAREHLDRVLDHPKQDFFITLTDCFYQLDVSKKLPFTLLSVVNSSKQRLYKRKSTQVCWHPAVYVPELSTGDMQARLQFGIPGNATKKTLISGGRLIDYMDDITPGDFVVAWDPIWMKFECSPNYEHVNVGDYICYHGIFCHEKWASENAKLALNSFMNIFSKTWERNNFDLLKMLNNLCNNLNYVESFAQSCGKEWSGMFPFPDAIA
ncbi:MAG: hypothetical protein V3U87_05415 [Methylococcaceae bacterium]